MGTYPVFGEGAREVYEFPIFYSGGLRVATYPRIRWRDGPPSAEHFRPLIAGFEKALSPAVAE